MKNPTFFIWNEHFIQMDDQNIALVISRKSRVIMADGKISLKILAPPCSKTKMFLEDRDIHIIQD